MLRHKEYHLITMLKTAAIAVPAIMGLFSSGIIVDKNEPVGVGLFIASGMFLFISMSNIIEDSKLSQ